LSLLFSAKYIRPCARSDPKFNDCLKEHARETLASPILEKGKCWGHGGTRATPGNRRTEHRSIRLATPDSAASLSPHHRFLNQLLVISFAVTCRCRYHWRNTPFKLNMSLSVANTTQRRWQINEWVRTTGGMALTGENRSTGRKTCHSAILCTTNLRRTDLGSNPDLGGERPATIRLSHDKAFHLKYWPFCLAICTFSCNKQILPSVHTVLIYFISSSQMRGGADKSLSRSTIVSLERKVCSCAELQVFSCYRGWKEACQATRAIQ